MEDTITLLGTVDEPEVTYSDTGDEEDDEEEEEEED